MTCLQGYTTFAKLTLFGLLFLFSFVVHAKLILPLYSVLYTLSVNFYNSFASLYSEPRVS